MSVSQKLCDSAPASRDRILLLRSMRPVDTPLGRVDILGERCSTQASPNGLILEVVKDGQQTCPERVRARCSPFPCAAVCRCPVADCLHASYAVHARCRESDMGMKQSIIEWLESVPGPTEAQAHRWRRVRWGLVGLAVVAEILLWYVLYRMDVNDPPMWLSVPADWLLDNVPAAQGHTNLSFALREHMPYVFTIGFVFSAMVAISFLLFNHNRLGFYVAGNILRMPWPKAIFAIFFGEIAMVLLVYFKLYGFTAEVSLSGEKTSLAYIDEIPLAVMGVWVPFYGLFGVIFGQHLSFLRDLFRRW